MIGNEMTILWIIVLKFNACTILKITTYCNISPDFKLQNETQCTHHSFCLINIYKKTK